ncbi:hypothetical protein AAFF_G00414040 [Aldrovandia affinis]|uniref:Trichohyalin-plectin-homology domain-containing protein n=1 Tax=Aldrovandia affinis TaxID=143900 RepID=A0AAD7SDH0_9TELE|nr:hypothetical protein AAFF_G00414040 [Aldrovandia affinis]
MAATSTNVSSNGTNGRKGLEESRQRAIDYAARHQFYQSDCVKQFHRALLLTETLNDSRLQNELNQRIKKANDEDTRKFMAEIRRGEMAAVEQEQQRAKRRESDSKAHVDFLRRQMQEREDLRHQQKLAKQQETQKSKQLWQQCEGDRRALRQRQHEDKMTARNEYLQCMAEKRSNAADDHREEAEAEAARQRCVGEKDRWTSAVNERLADRLRRRERRSEAVGARLAAQERERAGEQDALDAAAMAGALARKEERFSQEQSRQSRAQSDLASAMAAQRDHRRRERQRRASEERRQGQATLGGNREADRAHWETERQAAQRQREARATMNAALDRQVAEKRLQEEARRQAESDFHRKNLELLAQEDLQFRRYAEGVIGAAQGRERNTVPMRKAAERGRGMGVGPISGGIRANYLVPGATRAQMPEYVDRTAQDIARLYSNATSESTGVRLGFIW